MKNTFVLFLFFISLCLAQNNNKDLVAAYLNKGDVEKAYTILDGLNATEKIDLYEEYRVVVYKLNKLEEWKKFLDRTDQENYLIELDRILVNKDLEDVKAYNKLLKETKKKTSGSFFDTQQIINATEKRKAYLLEQEFILAYRQQTHEELSFASEMAYTHYHLGEKELMITEYLNFVEAKPEMLEFVQEKLQDQLKPNDRTVLENQIYKRLAVNNSYLYNEMLAWIYVQNREFYKAFIEKRSIDVKRNLKGNELFEFGQVVYNNGDYNTAQKIYEYLTKTYSGMYVAYKSQVKLLEAKEALISSQYPVDEVLVTELINQYQLLIQSTNRIDDKVDAQRKIARFKAYYLNDYDAAEKILTDLIANRRIGARRMAEAKLDLADIYVFNGNEWEAILLYGQVAKEAEFVDEDLVHQAKLKTGKAYYYMSDFDLAKEYLNILKLATSRTIANDAIDLAVFIQDNLGLDTSTYVLTKYANAERLLIQKKYESALRATNELENEISASHGIRDEIYWLRARIYNQIRDTEKEKENYRKMLSMQDDIYTDDALYKLARITETENDISSAMEYYKRLMIEYPGSIYVAEARKRYRELRGDSLSN